MLTVWVTIVIGLGVMFYGLGCVLMVLMPSNPTQAGSKRTKRGDYNYTGLEYNED